MAQVFEPYTLGPLELRNRIVRAAVYEKRADEDGYVTPELLSLYSELSAGGAGLIITGQALVHPSGRTLRRMLCAHSDLYARSLEGIAHAVHAQGGLVALQLNHGGRQCPPIMLGGEQALAPSAIYEPLTESTPRAMLDHEIWDCAEAFGDAALRARAAGFDAVELHAAHGYLISSFLSPHTNVRDDYWGGDEQRRMHFLEEVVAAVQRAVGDAFPLIVKVNVDDFVHGGLKPDAALGIAQALQAMGVHAIELSGGMREPLEIEGLMDEAREAPPFRPAARLLKQYIGVPLILTGGIRSLRVMQDILAQGEADLLGMARPLIREPDLPLKLADGRATRAACISCNKCARYSRTRRVECKQLNAEDS